MEQGGEKNNSNLKQKRGKEGSVSPLQWKDAHVARNGALLISAQAAERWKVMDVCCAPHFKAPPLRTGQALAPPGGHHPTPPPKYIA